MAKLNDTAKALGVELKPKQQPSFQQEKAIGHKRRDWLSNDNEPKNISSSPTMLLRPWQYESVLYASNHKHDTNLGQTEDKSRTNVGQIEDKSRTNVGQIEDKSRTNVGQIEDKCRTNLGQIEDKCETQTRTKTRTKKGRTNELNLGQTRDQFKTNKIFARLSGLQRDVLLFIYDECQAIANMETPPLRSEYLATCCKSTILSIRKTIQRMELKNLLIRSSYKLGRGGWTQYQLPDDIYQEINYLKSTNKLRTNLGQIEDKCETQTRTQTRTKSLSSSSINNKKTTTTELSGEWNFDIAPYAKFGFTVSQVKQLVPLDVISAAAVEQSLIEFNFDLENNFLPAMKSSKINFLMGLLRKGIIYTSEAYLNDQEATISEMARVREAKNKKLLEAKFIVWESSLNEDEKKDIEKKLPTHLIALYRTHGTNNGEVKNWLFDYYVRNFKGQTAS